MKELNRDKHYYFNEEGLMVFTALYHLQRGYCCGNNCLHCPYRDKEAAVEHENFPDKEKNEKTI